MKYKILENPNYEKNLLLTEKINRQIAIYCI